MLQIESRFQVAKIAYWLACVGWLLIGCSSGPRCRPDACAGGMVCDLDGTCRVLSERRDAAFATATRLSPARFEATRSDQDAPTMQLDEVALGGPMDGRLYLQFDLPPGRIVSAVLTLSTADEAAPSASQRVQVFGLRGLPENISRTNEPGRGRAGAQRELTPGSVLHLDVTDLAREATDASDPLLLGIDAATRGARPWRIATPRALDSQRRPTLHVRYVRPS